MQRNQLPVFIFGVSGATWKVLDPMLKAGRLPNLQRLCEEGSSGILMSTRSEGDKHYRPQVAWPTIATGCSPSKHGVTKFFHTADELKAPALWDIYQAHGHSVGLYGWPITWPPSQVNGFLIPSHHGRDSQAWPPELTSIKALDRGQQEAERDGGTSPDILRGFRTLSDIHRNGLQLRTIPVLGQAITKLLFSKSVEENSLFLRHAKLEINTDFFIKLYRQFQPTFSTFTTFLVDLTSHRCWFYYQPEKFSDAPTPSSPWLKHAVEHAYERVDRCLGRILSILPPEVVIALISEHGMSEEPVSTEVGPWRYLIRGNRLKELIGLSDSLKACPVARWIAFQPTEGKKLPPDTAARFRNIIVAETGLPLFQVYQHGEDEVIVKFKIERNISQYRDGDLERLNVVYESRKVPFSWVARRLGPRRSAMHDREGIIILSGSGIKRGFHIPESNLVDVAPTVLQASNMSVQSHFEGKALDVFVQT